MRNAASGPRGPPHKHSFHVPTTQFELERNDNYE